MNEHYISREIKLKDGGLLEDEQIVELYLKRSENAISETDRKYRTRCLYVAHNILNDLSDAEECLNDTYMTAWNTIPPERPKFLSAFLFRIIKNHSLNRLRYNHRDKRETSLSISLSELEECVDGKQNTEDEFDENQLALILNDFLRGLDEEKRFIFIRRYWYMDSIGSIAERCSRTEENVKTILVRIRKQLKKYLEERGISQ